MVGTRVTPDNNDIVVWKLDESAAPFVNSSTSSNAISTANSNLTVLSGNAILQQPSPFSAGGTGSAVLFTGNNSGSPRNFISGGNLAQPQPPLTLSGWIFLRTYDSTSATQILMAKQQVLNTWSGSSFGSLLMQNRRAISSSQANQFDFAVITTLTNTGADVLIPAELTIPIHTWAHIGLTYDGTNLQAFVNGNQVGTAVASPTGNIAYSGTPGPWFFGNIPVGGPNEEPQYSICDVRIANVVRSQSYFQNIYQNGVLNAGVSSIVTFYKMRAFDVLFTTTPVYWTDTVISYTNAPASPSGSGLGPIEVLETWNALNV